MIASPADVEGERLAATEIIHDWTDDNSEEEGIALLPIRWERHSAPELSGRPQEIINKNLVAKSDILIALFWTRLGSPTGEEDSGTVEEIMKFHQAGKLVMVYFCLRDIPRKHDPEQLKKLDEFMLKTQPLGIYHTYKDIPSLREDLKRHLTIQMRKQSGAKVAVVGEPRLPLPSEMVSKITLVDNDAINPHSLRTYKMQSNVVEPLFPIVPSIRDGFEQMVIQGNFHNFKVGKGVVTIAVIPLDPVEEKIDFTKFSDDEWLVLLPFPSDSEAQVHRYRDKILILQMLREAHTENILELSVKGRVFSICNWFDVYLPGDAQITYVASELWDKLVKQIYSYLETLRGIGVLGSYAVCISMIGFQNTLAVPSEDFVKPARIRVNQDKHIQFDIVKFHDSDVANFEFLASKLLPVYKEIWSQYGYPNVPKFDNAGKFIGF